MFSITKVFSLFAIFALIITFSACDGQKRMHKTPQEVLKESKLLDSFSENITYFPKEYTEVVTDTILSNGFRIKIKHYTNMNNSVLNEIKSDSILFKKYYRNFTSEIIITKNNKELFNKKFSKHSFLENEKNKIKNIDELIMSSPYVDYERSNSEKKAIINFPFCTTDTGHCLFYELTIDDKGTFLIKLTENNNNFYH